MLVDNRSKARMATGNKDTKFTADRTRFPFVLIIVAFAFAYLIYKTIWFQLNDTTDWQKKTDNTFIRNVIEPSKRGQLLDRHGAILAISETRANIVLDPYKLPNFDQQRQNVMKRHRSGNYADKIAKINEREEKYINNIHEVARILNLPVKGLLKDFNFRTYEKDNATKRQKVLAKSVDQSVVDKLSVLNVGGLKIEPTELRHYPDGYLFGSVIGFTKNDWNNESNMFRTSGLEGLEYAHNTILQGIDGKRKLIKDNHDNFIDVLPSSENKAPVDGQNIVLSLDKNIQALAVDALKTAVEYHKANKASAVVLDAKTGEILALANYPTFNPEQFTKYSPEMRKNHAVTDVVEPGSTVKPLFIAKALDDGLIHANDVFYTGAFNVNGREIRDTHVYPQLDVTGIITKSSNIGAAKIALKIKRENLHHYMQDLGLSQKVNAGLGGEAKGVVHPWEKWAPLHQANIGFGYHFQISLLHLARSYTIFTNDGKLLPLSIMKQDVVPEGVPVIKPETAATVAQMMQTVTEPGGTGTLGAVAGYHVAAKSGTAKKLGKGGYQDKTYNALFAGFAPVHNPRVIVAVLVDHPKENGYYGGVVSAPVFSKIMGGTLSLMNVPKTKYTSANSYVQ